VSFAQNRTCDAGDDVRVTSPAEQVEAEGAAAPRSSLRISCTGTWHAQPWPTAATPSQRSTGTLVPSGSMMRVIRMRSRYLQLSQTWGKGGDAGTLYSAPSRS